MGRPKHECYCRALGRISVGSNAIAEACNVHRRGQPPRIDRRDLVACIWLYCAGGSGSRFLSGFINVPLQHLGVGVAAVPCCRDAAVSRARSRCSAEGVAYV